MRQRPLFEDISGDATRCLDVLTSRGYGSPMLRRGIALSIVGVLLVTACTGGSSRTTAMKTGSGGILRVGMSGGAYFAFDPQYEWLFSTWELFHCCLLRTLMSYNETSGPTGTIPEPDLASRPPDVSSDGLTWTFHIRAGLHYGPPLQN